MSALAADLQGISALAADLQGISALAADLQGRYRPLVGTLF